jgi:hypothetical protein
MRPKFAHGPQRARLRGGLGPLWTQEGKKPPSDKTTCRDLADVRRLRRTC